MTSTSLPALFLGHGNPMNALADNAWTAGWRRLGEDVVAAHGRPRAVLCISAHWYGPGCAVTAMAKPRTIHDFGNFPRPLFEVQYPAPGDPALARRIAALLAARPEPVAAVLDESWGLDHGAWAVLCHVFPAADVPVVQLRIDASKPPAFHHALGRALGALRDEGVLLAGSGNLVHSLATYDWGNPARPAHDWAARFEARARALMQAGDDAPLVAYPALGEDALRSIPTPEHYLPLLYVLGARRPGDDVTFPVEGVDGGGISMLSVRVG